MEKKKKTLTGVVITRERRYKCQIARNVKCDMNMNTENTSKRQRLYLGIDFGTSGARYALIDDQGNLCSERKRAYPEVISFSNEQLNIYL